MHAETKKLLESRGYALLPDGTYGRPDSHQAPAKAMPSKREAKKALALPPEKSPLAEKFEDCWRLLKGPELKAEHQFHPERRWRFDYVHLGAKVAIELDGGIFSKGRHSRAKGFQGDCEKLNAGTALGYIIFRLPTGMATREHIEPIIAFIRERSASTPTL